MFGTNWSDPQTLWLNITNLALGLVTLLALAVVGVSVARELLLRRRRAHEVNGLDAELQASDARARTRMDHGGWRQARGAFLRGPAAGRSAVEVMTMSCPFLREGRARYCHAADMRKLILEGPGASSGGRCVSPAFRECSLAKEKGVTLDRCPHLEEIHVQYCGASPTQKLVPFSESQLSRCGGDGYRFCDSYLTLARPHRPMEAPPDVLYSSNHLWLDVGENGLCHVGVDAFLAEVAGSLDGVTFVTTRGAQRPVVALTVQGVEWPMRFPNPIVIEAANGHARIDPLRVTADPYGSGWLFQGREVPGKTCRGLISGQQFDRLDGGGARTAGPLRP